MIDKSRKKPGSKSGKPARGTLPAFAPAPRHYNRFDG